MLTPEKTSWALAQEIFHAIGMAAVASQTYSVSHRRVAEALEKAISLIEHLFQQLTKAQHITFMRSGDQIEFRNVPLARTGYLGDRLARALKARGCAGLQLERGITAQDLVALLTELRCTRIPDGGFSGEGEKNREGAVPKFHLASQAEIDEIRAKNLLGRGATWGTHAIPDLSVFEGTAQNLLSAYRGVFANLGQPIRFSKGLLAETVDRVVALLGSEKERLVLGASGEYFDDFTYRHSVNVCLITAMLASEIIKDPQTLRRISVAALLHDVGKGRVPEEILHKPGRLTPEEEAVVQLHPGHGAEILLAAEDMDPLCIAVAFGHHKVLGRSPYPGTLRPYTCDWITRLVSIVDVYEALTAQRPYKRGMSTDAAFKIMLTMPGMDSQTHLLRLLYNTLSPFPVGSLVELSTGERAVVTGLNPETPRLPRVRVLTDPSRQELAEPLDLDLSQPSTSAYRGTPRVVSQAVVKQSLDHDALAENIEP